MDCLLCARHFLLSCCKNLEETGLQGWGGGVKCQGNQLASIRLTVFTQLCLSAKSHQYVIRTPEWGEAQLVNCLLPS